MKYIFIVLLFLVIAISAYLFLGRPENIIESTTKGSPINVEEHFNAKDLAKLGCNVENAEEKSTSITVPMVGTIQGYGLKNVGDCNVDLISTLSKINKGDEGAWAGVRASSNIKAEKDSYVLSMYEGNVGDYSEIHIFEKGGQQVGFRYIVELNGILHNVTIFSDKIMPDNNFESIFKKRIQ